MRRSTRVYIPTTLAGLADLHHRGALAARRGHAVTAWMRQSHPDADAEELAYLAYRDAARESLILLGGDPAVPRRRVVVAADVPVDLDGAPAGGSAVALVGAVPQRAVASLHIDGSGAEADVAAAASQVLIASELDAVPVVAEAEEHELEWFDISELAQLVGVGGPYPA